MRIHAPSRRQFLASTAAAGAIAGVGDFNFLAQLSPVRAAEAQVNGSMVQLRPEIEPLVRLLEETPRDQVLEAVAQRVRAGTSYQELLAALFLAGVRNVQPRPSVGFKFHAVLVVNSAHLASLAAPDQDRWLPIFWAVDEFKSSQARDEREGNWTMGPVDEAAVPSPLQAAGAFEEAMEKWDESAADAAVAGLYRAAGSHTLFEAFARYGIRDFRSIGHKAIYVANSWRTLQCIGWQHAEPVLRSLAYALLNHSGEPNPATSDLAPDRPGRSNLERLSKLRKDWREGELNEDATRELLKVLRQASPDDACDQVVELLNGGVAPQSIYDGLLVAAGELLSRQPGIVGLHAVTSTNAMRYLFETTAEPVTQQMTLLQNTAFLCLFRQEMMRRGKLRDASLDELEPAELPAEPAEAISAIFDDVSDDPRRASQRLLGYLRQGRPLDPWMQAARRLIFLKGNDSHDYKFSSAVLEDYFHASPGWRDLLLASSVYNLSGSKAPDNGLVKRIRGALQA